MRARWTPISRKYPNHSAAATIARACSRRRAKGSDVESDDHANDYASTLRHNIQSHCPLVSGSHTTTPMSLGPRVPTQVTGFARCGTEVSLLCDTSMAEPRSRSLNPGQGLDTNNRAILHAE
ncbi:hypothetical protein M438DRAFT_6834 [Aureobasidium pullulans EXF-150]|uniref:Uncharacterized protein n=1 Tax=Aureobasidium pullulans EXF-150 TaxID=1043002 RepID=A0A074Y0M1_AURPU|nr:uncharacterized protein M438DRAFT_6834 [Aureobasidium pullulans EXF-150]KEQ89459.1 hypothetical protein M438DRAFT_6834 [Aureobasidium pullulans EXF-150]